MDWDYSVYLQNFLLALDCTLLCHCCHSGLAKKGVHKLPELVGCPYLVIAELNYM